jgi:hypothetical protein
MSARLGRIFSIILTLLIVFLVFVAGSLGQADYRATLASFDSSSFPHLNAYLDVHDPGGEFIHGLTAQDVFMVENGVQVPLNLIQEQKPGVQFVLAITPGASFSIRDVLGVSRYEYLLQAFLAGTWTDQPAGLDDFSLLTQGGPQLTHSPDPAALRSALETYKPSGANAVPSLEVLASALQVASDPTVRPGMEKAILFITPPQESDVSLGLQSIIASATQQDIHIYVWLVASQDVFTMPKIDLLRGLADQTHAAFFAFSREETVPDLETLLESLRYVYRLGYDSQIKAAGLQQVLAQVNTGIQQITTQPISFELNLQPPLPAILNPPAEIVRTFSNQPTPATGKVTGDLLPEEQVLIIQVNYPDGYQHQLSRTNLYVDGAMVAENAAPPFDRFVWDLRPYVQDGMHTLSVEAIDNLGLIGRTDEITVKIAVPSTTQGMIVAVSNNRLMVIGITVFISATILILVLILGGRIHPKPYPGQGIPQARSNEKTSPLGYRERLRMLRDPVTQPVKISSGRSVNKKPKIKNWIERLPSFKHKPAPTHAMAYLMPMVGTNDPTIPTPLEITADDITLGSDSRQANLVITDPSIEGLHARIHHEGKSFLLMDAGSVAGTWVNYVRVAPEGKLLEHADIIHFGNIGFRFNLSEPGQSRKIVVTPLEPDQ